MEEFIFSEDEFNSVLEFLNDEEVLDLLRED